MTKKHFIQIAKTFALKNKGASPEAKDALRAVAETLCDTFKAINPAFNRQLFLDACGF